MRLLKKSDIVAKKSGERKQEIDQGLQLAKRIDRLRETASIEEASLRDFRDKMVASINQEIKSLSDKKDALMGEVTSLRQEKEAGLEVLKNKQETLEKWSDTLHAKDKDLTAKFKKLADDEKIIKDKLLLAEEEVDKAVSFREQSYKILKDSFKLLEKARKVALTISIDRDSLERLTNDISEKLLTRELNIAAKERDVKIKQEHIANQKSELGIRETQLADKYYALEKAKKHLGIK